MRQIYRFIGLSIFLHTAAGQAVTAEIGQTTYEGVTESKKSEIRQVISEEAKKKKDRSKVKHLSLEERQTLRMQIRLQQATQKPKKNP
jgi:hypothetical protein